jgi:hypothetical protein
MRMNRPDDALEELWTDALAAEELDDDDGEIRVWRSVS